MTDETKIKSKTVRKTLANKDVLEMFDGALGVGGTAAVRITYPKYQAIKTHTARFLKLLGMLRDSAVMARFPDIHGAMVRFLGVMQAEFDAAFVAPDFTPHLAADPVVAAVGGAEYYQRVPVAMLDKFVRDYGAMKNCSLVNSIIVTCSNLAQHKRSLASIDALKDKFLTGAGSTFTPLPGIWELNFKHVYSGLAKEDRKFVLTVLHKMYTVSHDVYEAVSSPDVDVNELVEAVMNSVGDLRKRIPRCDDAFDKIIASVDLLKSNFGGYYKDYSASGNSAVIMENFVIDVSKQSGPSVGVTAQFRRIISHYKDIASSGTLHPKLKSVFAQANANFKELERRDAGGADAASDGSDDEGDAAASEPELAVADPAAPEVSAATARNRRKRAKVRAKARALEAGAPEAKSGGLAGELDEMDATGPHLMDDTRASTPDEWAAADSTDDETAPCGQATPEELATVAEQLADMSIITIDGASDPAALERLLTSYELA